MKKIKSRVFDNNKNNEAIYTNTRLIVEQGMLIEESIGSQRVNKKWYEFYKKDTFIMVVKYRFIRAVEPSLKIMLEC